MGEPWDVQTVCKDSAPTVAASMEGAKGGVDVGILAVEGSILRVQAWNPERGTFATPSRPSWWLRLTGIPIWLCYEPSLGFLVASFAQVVPGCLQLYEEGRVVIADILISVLGAVPPTISFSDGREEYVVGASVRSLDQGRQCVSLGARVCTVRDGGGRRWWGRQFEFKPARPSLRHV